MLNLRRGLLSAGLLLATTVPALGQTYPTKPIRMVVPFPPGGTVDTNARAVAREVEPLLGQPLVIDNRGGANGILGIEIVARSQPDGYVLLHTAANFAINPSMYRKLPFDVRKDFTPITNVALGLGYLLTVHPSVPVQSVKEFIVLAKNPANDLRYGTPGIGNGQHLAAVWFNLKAGTTMLHVPYKGAAPALNAALGGEVQVIFPSGVVGASHVKAGRLRALGYTGGVRLASLPDVPTIAEAGVPDFRFDAGWHAWFGPANMPEPVVNRLHATIRKALESQRLREFFAAGGYEPKGESPAEFRKILDADIKRYAEIVKAAKIEPE
jgi:tripartite-type tricarboxylate transporter receptor subunit TctC